MKANISEHITYAEATKSPTAIKYGIINDPPQDVLEKMTVVANLIFEVVRDKFGKPIAVVSFYRSFDLNEKVGGSDTSQHMTGEAMDLDADVFGGLTNKDIFHFIRKYLEFDQLIAEFPVDGNPSWVHVSYSKKNRRSVLVSYKDNGATKYRKYENIL